jgi:hypothetical protein
MTAVEEIASNLKMDTERVHFEHEHLEDELQDLDAAIQSIDFDSQPLPELDGMAAAGVIVRNLECELPGHFREEEGTLLPDLARLNPELTDWVGAMEHNDVLIWRELEAIRTSLERLKSSTEMTEDLDQIQSAVAKLRHLIHTHAHGEEMVAEAVLRDQELALT